MKTDGWITLDYIIQMILKKTNAMPTVNTNNIIDGDAEEVGDFIQLESIINSKKWKIVFFRSFRFSICLSKHDCDLLWLFGMAKLES